MKANKNRVTICAKVVSEPEVSHSYKDINFYKFNVSILRNSGTKDIIPCIVRYVPNIHSGDYVKIYGKFTSRIDEHLENYLNVSKIHVIDRYYNNYIELEGYICSDPVFFDHLKKGRKINKFLLASNTKHKANYIPCFTYGIYAEITKNCKNGDFIKGVGRLETRHIDKLDSNREITEVCLTKLEVIEK
jgi:hypothetical protein